jgi:hypothetical protein
MGHVDGTMMSTVPLAMLVMLGGVANVRLRIVGWMENGLTPLRDQPISSMSSPMRPSATYSTAGAGSALTSVLTWTALFTGGRG